MNNAFQWLLAILSITVAVIIIGVGIAGIAVVIGFLMIPTGIYSIVRGVQNLTRHTQSIITLEFPERYQFTVHPLWEIIMGMLLLVVGFNLTQAFLGIALTGIAIYFLVFFLVNAFRKS